VARGQGSQRLAWGLRGAQDASGSGEGSPKPRGRPRGGMQPRCPAPGSRSTGDADSAGPRLRPRRERRGSWEMRLGFRALGRSKLTEPGLPALHQPLRTPCWRGRSRAARRSKARQRQPRRTLAQSRQRGFRCHVGNLCCRRGLFALSCLQKGSGVGSARPGPFLMQRSLFGACSAHTGLIKNLVREREWNMGPANREPFCGPSCTSGQRLFLQAEPRGVFPHRAAPGQAALLGQRTGSLVPALPRQPMLQNHPSVVPLQRRAGPFRGPSPWCSLPKACAVPGTTTFPCPGNGWVGNKDTWCCLGIHTLV